MIDEEKKTDETAEKPPAEETIEEEAAKYLGMGGLRNITRLSYFV